MREVRLIRKTCSYKIFYAATETFETSVHVNIHIFTQLAYETEL